MGQVAWQRWEWSGGPYLIFNLLQTQVIYLTLQKPHGTQKKVTEGGKKRGQIISLELVQIMLMLLTGTEREKQNINRDWSRLNSTPEALEGLDELQHDNICGNLRSSKETLNTSVHCEAPLVFPHFYTCPKRLQRHSCKFCCHSNNNTTNRLHRYDFKSAFVKIHVEKQIWLL